MVLFFSSFVSRKEMKQGFNGRERPCIVFYIIPYIYPIFILYFLPKKCKIPI
jgi:hypothetical protein